MFNNWIINWNKRKKNNFFLKLPEYKLLINFFLINYRYIFFLKKKFVNFYLSLIKIKTKKQKNWFFLKRRLRFKLIKRKFKTIKKRIFFILRKKKCYSFFFYKLKNTNNLFKKKKIKINSKKNVKKIKNYFFFLKQDNIQCNYEYCSIYLLYQYFFIKQKIKKNYFLNFFNFFLKKFVSYKQQISLNIIINCLKKYYNFNQFNSFLLRLLNFIIPNLKKFQKYLWYYLKRILKFKFLLSKFFLKEKGLYFNRFHWEHPADRAQVFQSLKIKNNKIFNSNFFNFLCSINSLKLKKKKNTYLFIWKKIFNSNNNILDKKNIFLLKKWNLLFLYFYIKKKKLRSFFNKNLEKKKNKSKLIKISYFLNYKNYINSIIKKFSKKFFNLLWFNYEIFWNNWIIKKIPLFIFFKKNILKKINYIYYKNFFFLNLYKLNFFNLIKKFNLKRASFYILSKNIGLSWKNSKNKYKVFKINNNINWRVEKSFKFLIKNLKKVNTKRSTISLKKIKSKYLIKKLKKKKKKRLKHYKEKKNSDIFLARKEKIFLNKYKINYQLSKLPLNSNSYNFSEIYNLFSFWNLKRIQRKFLYFKLWKKQIFNIKWRSKYKSWLFNANIRPSKFNQNRFYPIPRKSPLFYEPMIIPDFNKKDVILFKKVFNPKIINSIFKKYSTYFLWYLKYFSDKKGFKFIRIKKRKKFKKDRITALNKLSSFFFLKKKDIISQNFFFHLGKIFFKLRTKNLKKKKKQAIFLNKSFWKLYWFKNKLLKINFKINYEKKNLNLYKKLKIFYKKKLNELYLKFYRTFKSLKPKVKELKLKKFLKKKLSKKRSLVKKPNFNYLSNILFKLKRFKYPTSKYSKKKVIPISLELYKKTKNSWLSDTIFQRLTMIFPKLRTSFYSKKLYVYYNFLLKKKKKKSSLRYLQSTLKKIKFLNQQVNCSLPYTSIGKLWRSKTRTGKKVKKLFFFRNKMSKLNFNQSRWFHYNFANNYNSLSLLYDKYHWYALQFIKLKFKNKVASLIKGQWDSVFERFDNSKICFDYFFQRALCLINFKLNRIVIKQINRYKQSKLFLNEKFSKYVFKFIKWRNLNDYFDIEWVIKIRKLIYKLIQKKLNKEKLNKKLKKPNVIDYYKIKLTPQKLYNKIIRKIKSLKKKKKFKIRKKKLLKLLRRIIRYDNSYKFFKVKFKPKRLLQAKLKKRWRILFKKNSENLWKSINSPFRSKHSTLLKEIWRTKLLNKILQFKEINIKDKESKNFRNELTFKFPKRVYASYNKFGKVMIKRKKNYFVYKNIYPLKTPIIRKIPDVIIRNNQVHFSRNIIIKKVRVSFTKYRVLYENRFLFLINLTQKLLWFNLINKKNISFLFTNWFFFREKLALFFCNKIKHLKIQAQYFILWQKNNLIPLNIPFVLTRKQKINWKWIFGKKQRWRRRRQNKKFLANYSLISNLKYYKEYNFRILKSTIFPSLFNDNINFSYDWSKRFHNSFTFFLYKGC